MLHFSLSVYNSTKNFGLGFALVAQMSWNDLPDDVCLAISLPSFRKEVGNLSLC